MTLEDSEKISEDLKKEEALMRVALLFGAGFYHRSRDHFLWANAILQELVGMCLALLPPEAREISKRDLLSMMRDVGYEVYEDEKDWMSRRNEKEEERHRAALNKLLKKEET